MPVQFEKQQIERDKQLLTNKRTEENLADLRKDRAMMQVKSPADGYVYYGRCTRGKWSGVESVSSQLAPGRKLSPQTVFMTVVNPRRLHIRVDIPEKELYRVERGLMGKAVPTAYPEMELETTVGQVSPIPIGSGVFDGHLKVKLNEQAAPIVPGMACKLTLSVCDKKDAITVPATAVFEDEASGKRNLVYVKKEDGSAEKRTVTIGQKTEKKWEITEGLQEGEEILLSKPDAS